MRKYLEGQLRECAEKAECLKELVSEIEDELRNLEERCNGAIENENEEKAEDIQRTLDMIRKQMNVTVEGINGVRNRAAALAEILKESGDTQNDQE